MKHRPQPTHDGPSFIGGPSVRWINPLRRRVWQEPDGTWTARYRWRSHGGHSESVISGCTSKEEALSELEHGLRMRYMQRPDGRFVEVIKVDGVWTEVPRDA